MKGLENANSCGVKHEKHSEDVGPVSESSCEEKDLPFERSARRIQARGQVFHQSRTLRNAIQ